MERLKRADQEPAWTSLVCMGLVLLASKVLCGWRELIT